MRIERWWWLPVFCLVSLAIHIGIGFNSRTFVRQIPPPPRTVEIEVALEPLPAEPEPKRMPRSEPEPPAPGPKPAPVPEKDLPVRGTPFAPRPRSSSAKIAKAEGPVRPPRVVRTEDRRPTAPRAEPGGADPDREQKPLPLGLAIGRVDRGAPRLARPDRLPGGGGSPAPGPVLGGTGGAPGTEAPPEEIAFNGGGAGGVRLPVAAPRIGGGGGRSVLSVPNPLAKDALPEDKPGLGPGTGGGQGVARGTGVGAGRGPGIGTRLDGKIAVATLRARPGPGIGAGAGRGLGTRPPGGGTGTGAELPGTGGSGLGSGRGSGLGIGDGRGAGIGDGDNGGRTALRRGIPFGDIAGLLRGGDPNGGGGSGGGPGGPGRGSVFGTRPGGGGGGGGGGSSSAPVRIVYVLDVSGSMNDGGKIVRAQHALKTALSELKPTDAFNIIPFAGRARALSSEMIPATRENVQLAGAFVDSIRARGDTNLSSAMEMALALEGATHIFLLSDGEPKAGITDPDEIRAMIREMNQRRGARILTLALGLGEQFPGIPLLKGIAEDNNGKFDYVNLSR
jgi:uncharacterized protein YegL